jgi:CheY-like chemotaxis protein
MPVPNYPFPSAALPLAQEHILVVDDEALIRETIALALTDEGHQVTALDSGTDSGGNAVSRRGQRSAIRG